MKNTGVKDAEIISCGMCDEQFIRGKPLLDDKYLIDFFETHPDPRHEELCGTCIYKLKDDIERHLEDISDHDNQREELDDLSDDEFNQCPGLYPCDYRGG
jgi:hypothetical protein